MKKRFLVTIILILYITGIAANAAWYDSELESSRQKGFVSQKLYENPDKYITRAEVCDLLVSYYEYTNPGKIIKNKPSNFLDIENSEYKRGERFMYYVLMKNFIKNWKDYVLLLICNENTSVLGSV